ncbi:MAG: filamentous hemagglutinin family protein [Gammaproteobacteria bacterium]|nr:filamentous hemagglutinin family protein [Gammaproteobacteria bacterium]MBQ0840697.1 filamentous hemagglutinin family protein [Gammaproteobacteria bacterium]
MKFILSPNLAAQLRGKDATASISCLQMNKLAAASYPVSRVNTPKFRVSKVAALLLSACLPHVGMVYGELPVPCGGGSCAGASWLGGGAATQSIHNLSGIGQELRIQQLSERALFNWDTFNIGADDKVSFDQPGSSSLALNRIFQQSPSRLLGSIQANGQVYLINRAGIIFGKNSQVNVGTLLASSLEVPDIDANGLVGEADYTEFLDRGLTSFFTSGAVGSVAHALANREAEYSSGEQLPDSFSDIIGADGQAFTKGGIWVEQGAQLNVDELGKVMLFGSQVTNAGIINTPRGQTIIAASKNKLWIEPSSELRGFIIELDHGGDVNNLGEIIASEGNINLLGRVVRQDGLVRATTSVDFNGSIMLRAEEVASITKAAGNASIQRVYDSYGEVVIGADSVSEVVLEDSGDTAVDAQPFAPSRIEVLGEDIRLQSGARLTARNGLINVEARSSLGTDADAASITVESGVEVDVSGANAELAMSRNLIAVQLFSNELKDAPLQRTGALRGETLIIDVRKGSPLADITPALATIAKTVQEKAALGGSINFHSSGSVTFADDVQINLSGGEIHYREGFINTSRLITRGGQVLDVSEARPDLLYQGVFGDFTRDIFKWGVTQRWTANAGDFSVFESAYSQFQPGGTLAVSGAFISGLNDLDIITESRIGQYQRYQPPVKGVLEIGREATINFQKSFGAPGISILKTVSEPQREVLEQRGDVLITERFISDSGLSAIDVMSNGEIFIGSGGELLELPSFGSLKARAKRISVDGGVSSASGAIELLIDAPGAAFDLIADLDAAMEFADQTVFDVSGRWHNNFLEPATRPFSTVAIDAGSIVLDSALSAAINSAGHLLFDLNGGGVANEDGALDLGSGGELNINFGAEGMRLNADHDSVWTIRGYGADRGAEFALTAPQIMIDPEASESLSIVGNQFVVASSLFSQVGLSAIKLTATDDELVLPTGEYTLVREGFFAASQDFIEHPSGAQLSALLQPVLPPLADRSAVTLELGVAGENPNDLIIASGARINADAQSTITLRNRAEGKILLDGVISNPAGSVELLATSSSLKNYNALRNLIWLGPNSQIDVSGTAVAATDPAALPTAQVLDGGSVKLAATGYVYSEEGSRIDVSGTTGLLSVRGELPTGEDLAPGVSRATVGSDAGSLSVFASEGFVLAGQVSGSGGKSNNRGGLFAAAVKGERALNFVSTENFNQQRQLVLSDKSEVVPSEGFSVVDPSSAVGRRFVGIDDAGNGTGRLSLAAIADGGFTRVELAARHAIEFAARQDGASIGASFGERLFLEAPRLTANSDLLLQAPHIRLSSLSSNVALSDAESYSAHFAADLIDVLGTVSVDKVDSLLLDSAGDIRLGGVDGVYSGSGSLQARGLIELKARQVYPTTLASFAVIASESAASDGEIRIGSSGGAATSTLTAGGSFRLQADSVLVDGVLKAPFGSIEVAARNFVLASSGVLSVAGDAPLVPFGERFFNYLPEDSGVELLADRVVLEPGSLIDVSGGGDLVDWFFVAGPGGSADILDTQLHPNSYAIVPGVDTAPLVSNKNFSGDYIGVGATITLSGAQGLADGEYTLLPARYALLDGAWLINLEADYADISPASTRALLDGTPLVAGRFSIANSAVKSARYSALALRSGIEARTLSEFDEQLASDFQWQRSGVEERFWQPADAAKLQLAVVDELRLGGSIEGGAATGGRAGLMTVSADNLAVVNIANTTQADVELLADDLNRLDVGTLLIGGAATRTTKGLSIEATANGVEIVDGVELALPELLLTAKNKIVIGAASLVGKQASAAKIELSVAANDAVVGLLSSRNVVLNRTGVVAGPAAAISVADTALLASEGTALLSAPGEVSMSQASVLAPSLYLEARRIALGEGSPNDGRLRMLQANLDRLGESQSLTLKSAQSIAVYGDVSIDNPALSLTIAGPGLNNIEAGDLSINAQQVLFENSQQQVAAPVTQAGGVLSVDAERLLIGDNTTALQGWDEVVVNTGSLEAQGTGELNLAGADKAQFILSLLTARPGGELAVTSSGILSFLSGTKLAAVGSSGLGGRFSAAAEEIIFNTPLRMATGTVELKAEGNLTVGNDALLDVAGVGAEFLNIREDTWGGSVRLQSNYGDINITQGAIIDVSSGGPRQRSGSVEIIAERGRADIAGSLVAGKGGGTGAKGGRIKLDTVAFSRGDEVDAFSAINQHLNAQGFSAERIFRQREGDLRVSADTLITARNASVTVDEGSLQFNGVVDASGGDEDGGRIALSSRDNMSLGMTAQLSARSEQGEGGLVTVATEAGWLNIFDGAQIDVAGVVRGGQIDLRAPRTAAGDDVQVAIRDSEGLDSVLSQQLQGAGQIRVEGVRTYTAADGSISAADIAGYYADAEDFINTYRSAISARLGLDGVANTMLTPGVVVEREGNLVVDTAINFLDWVFDADANTGIGALLPGHFDLRATGDLTLNASLTSGAVEQCGRRGCSDFVSAEPSWSLALAAGVDGGQQSSPSNGDLLIADNTLVLTTTGDIDLSASGDMTLLGQVVSLGRPEGVEVPGGGRSPAVALPENGGDIQVFAGGSIRGNANQAQVPFVTDGMTLYESTTEPDLAGLITKGPSSNGAGYSFEVGSLGGGDIDISADGDISAFSVGATTALLLDKGVVTKRVNTANVAVKVAGDFNSSQLMVGDGEGYLQVGGAVGVDFNYGNNTAQPAYSRFALQAGRIAVNAVKDVVAGGALNPTLPYFLSFGENSAFAVQSLAGDIKINAKELSRDVAFNFPNNVGDQYRALPIQYPGKVSLTAHRGNIAVDGQMRLSPSAKGWLGLLAEGNITSSGGGVKMSEVDPGSIPLRGLGRTPQDLTTNVDKFAVLNESLLHAADEQPSAIISRRGNVGNGEGVFLLQLPMAVNMFAGGDVVRPKLRLKHGTQDSISRVTAGGDISEVDIEIEGPGRIDIGAANDIDFGLAPGVTSSGGLRDSRLAGLGGADINVYVGALPDTLNWSGFIDPYLKNTQLREQLLLDMKSFLKGLSKEAVTDRETLMAFLGTPGADKDNFTSETFKSPAELNNLIKGLALDLEMTAALAGSNMSDKLRDTFLVDPLFSENLVDSVRVFRSRSADELDNTVALQLFNVLSNEEQRLIVERTLLSLPETEQRQVARSVFEDTTQGLQRDLILEAFFGQLRDAGRLANKVGSEAFDLGYEAIATLFPETTYQGDLELESNYQGELVLGENRIYTLDGGDINLLIPGGGANAGLAPAGSSDASKVGVVVQKEGDVRAMVHDSFAVNQSRVFTLGGGNILLWASQGNLDAGRGAKTAISSPPPKVAFGSNGELIIDFGAAIAGSGIRQIETAQAGSNFVVDPNHLKPANGVDLVAPKGEVNAGDAGIGAAGNLNIAAARVIGAEQIEVGGVSVGIPDDNSGAATSLVGVSNIAGDATGGVADSAASQLQEEASNRLAFLEVNVLDYGSRSAAPAPRIRD